MTCLISKQHILAPTQAAAQQHKSESNVGGLAEGKDIKGYVRVKRELGYTEGKET